MKYILLLLTLGLLMRLGAVFGELWLDEVWSLQVVHALSGPFAYLTEQHLDNTSSLYSAYLWFMSEKYEPWLVRLLSFVFGLGALIAVPLLADKREKFISLLLFATSYVMVLYSTEARGYAGMLFFSLFSLLCLKKAKEDKAKNWEYAFAISTCLGFLFHYSFFQFYVAVLIATLFDSKLRRIRLHVPPLIMIASIYFLSIQHLAPGTGPLKGYLEVILNTVNVAFGIPELQVSRPQLSMVFLCAGILFAGIVLLELMVEFIEGKKDALLYTALIFIAPLVVLILVQPRVLFPRYFLIAILGAYIVYARFLTRLFERDFIGKIIAVAFAALFVGGNGYLSQQLWRHGRGDYRVALSKISAVDTRPEICVYGDVSFRHTMMTEYALKRLGQENRVIYVSDDVGLKRSCDWYFALSQDPFFSPLSVVDLGIPYLFQFEVPSAELSGWRLFVYRKSQSTRMLF